MSKAPFDILLAEDSPTDALLCRAALKEAGVECQIHHVENGRQVMAFLRREAEFQDAPRPVLLLLDLNLPVMDGREVLAQMKTDPALLRIPVIVLTTSQADEDIHAAYGLHANGYITKPLEFEAYTNAMRALALFWLQVAALPPAHPREIQA
jgi:CheY-like chemotaxis protein